MEKIHASKLLAGLVPAGFLTSDPERMISYGGSNYNISFLIKESDKKRALQSLSEVLFNNNDKQ